MDRKELYKRIKSNNLEEKIKKEFGRNFTQVSSKDLEKVVVAAEAAKVHKPVKPNCDMTKKLVEVLKKKRILLNSEVDYILGN